MEEIVYETSPAIRPESATASTLQLRQDHLAPGSWPEYSFNLSHDILYHLLMAPACSYCVPS